MSEHDARPGMRLAVARTVDRAAGSAQRLAAQGADAGGAAGRIALVAGHAARRLDMVAGYLRATETEEIVGDLEAAIRRHPLRALTMAFLAGYLTRRVF